MNNSLINSLKKFQDLINVDGPILSHFIDDNNHDYLVYWVDENEKSYKWIIFKISKLKLKSYLLGSLTLKNLLIHQKNSFIFFADTNKMGEFINIKLESGDKIPKDYLPDDNSYFPSSIPKAYEEYLSLETGSKSDLIEILQLNALFMRLDSKDLKHGRTLSLSDITEFTKNLNSSYLNFLEENYLKYFSDYHHDEESKKYVIKKLKSELNLRLVYCGFGSFSIGFSVDNLMIDPTISNEIRIWSRDVMNNYKNEVIEFDYGNKEKVNYVQEKYSEEAMRKIFKPIFDFTSSEKFEVYIRDINTNREKKISIKKQIASYLTELPKEIKTEPEKEFLTIAVEVEKDQLPNVRQIRKYPLLEERTNTITLNIHEFNTSKGYKVVLKEILRCNLSLLKKNMYQLLNEELDISVLGISKDDVIQKFGDVLLEYYGKYEDLNIEQREEETRLQNIYQLIKEIIKD